MAMNLINNSINSAHASSANFAMPVINGRPDFEFAAALKKVSPQAQAKAQTTATNFEAMFLNSMFSQMTSGLKGEGPFGDTLIFRAMMDGAPTISVSCTRATSRFSATSSAPKA